MSFIFLHLEDICCCCKQLAHFLKTPVSDSAQAQTNRYWILSRTFQFLSHPLTLGSSCTGNLCPRKLAHKAPLLSECRRQRKELQETGQGWRDVLSAEMLQGGSTQTRTEHSSCIYQGNNSAFQQSWWSSSSSSTGNSLWFLLPAPLGHAPAAAPQLQHRPGPCQGPEPQAAQSTKAVLSCAWTCLETVKFMIFLGFKGTE